MNTEKSHAFDLAYEAGHLMGKRKGMTWGIVVGAAIAWGTYLLGWVLTRWVL